MDRSSEMAIRLISFAGVFALMAIWEMAVPRRRLIARKPLRWFSNLGLVGINTLIVRIVLPMGAVGIALVAAEREWGLFNNVQTPTWAALVLSLIILDFAIYLQHVMFHAVPVLWRLHMVHHADLDFDVTTGLRFHTIEIVLSMLIKIGVIILLGPPVLAVLLFEVVLNASSMFNHANVRLPRWLDRALRLFLVTPEMHRVHHSVIVRETNSNFGFNLPWWDYLCGTYRHSPAAGHEHMTIGVAQFRDEHQVDRLPGILALPFAGRLGDDSTNPGRSSASEGSALTGIAEHESQVDEIAAAR